MPRILIRFRHGLGDAAQFTVVLKHLRQHRGDWMIHCWGKRGKHTAWTGLCDSVSHDQEADPTGHFDAVADLGWYENYNRYTDRPSSKITNCLHEVFGVDYDRSLGQYTINLSEPTLAKANAYLESIGCKLLGNGRWNAVLLHYEGNTSPDKKNLPHDTAGAFLHWALDHGYVPVVLDWDRRSQHPDNRRIFCPGTEHPLWGNWGSGDAETIAALIERSSLFVGVDSGPQKCAGATTTPSIGVWTKHHPVQFFDPCPTFIHLVPEPHRLIAPADHPGVAAYFERAYKFAHYPMGKVLAPLCWQAGRMLNVDSALPPADLYGFALDPSRANMDWVIIQDVYINDTYRLKLIQPDLQVPQVMIDIGAHVGSFARLFHERYPNCRIVCVEACPDNISLLKQNVGSFAEIVPAACTYESEAYLLNAVASSAPVSTGGSRVVSRVLHDSETDPQYAKSGLVPTVTLHQLLIECGIEQVDLLKLDCEGSEFSILEHAPLEKIHTIVGELHGLERWQALIARRFPNPPWAYGHMAQYSDLGIFHLRNDDWRQGGYSR